MKSEHITFIEIDKKQQERWEKERLFKAPQKPKAGKKFYCLDMFPYPSGQGLHVGHPEGYTASDIISRYKRMCGLDVLHPMGWDAFGLPAENYAIETGIHPEITTKKNIDTFRRQIKSLGLSYDWEREFSTTDPNYYRWTQWIFIQLFKKGLAYESNVAINWCPSCKTGLANEEVFGGKCERCGTEVERKKVRQWLLKITAYADRLLDDLQSLDWPSSTLSMQKNWIGRSEGAEIIFELKNSAHKIAVFTTRPDTIYGATYMVLSPEHELVEKITVPQRRAEVSQYKNSAVKKTEFERSDETREKTGTFTGAYAVNPVSGENIPVWIADYVLSDYGTGAIMAVPAHDERDWAFAKKFALKITQVVKPPQDWPSEKPFCGESIAQNSPIIDGLPTAQAAKKIIAFLEDKKAGCGKITYRLRDWVFSRQRYWGEPIPIIHCDKCGPVCVPEKDLPLTLPKTANYKPSGVGESPLADISNWVETKCPNCGGPGRRETNTMPQWAGSCWYYLRYIDPKNEKIFCDKELEKSWLPVDCYIGGAEHAVLHLLYARFWHKVLYDLGHVSTKEPFIKLRHQGMILSYSYRDERGVYYQYKDIDFSDENCPRLKDGGAPLTKMVEKMSKSKKNVVNPDEIINVYGADAFRMYEMFMGPFEALKPWDMKGIEGVSRFLKRIWFWAQEVKISAAPAPKNVEILMHKSAQKVSHDIENMGFNTAISAMMIYFNEMSVLAEIPKSHVETFLKLLHPFAPHITEEIWERLDFGGFLAQSTWPSVNAELLKDEEIEIAVQVNGKIRGRIKITAAMSNGEVEKLALSQDSVKAAMGGKAAHKVIVVPKRMVSVAVK